MKIYKEISGLDSNVLTRSDIVELLRKHGIYDWFLFFLPCSNSDFKGFVLYFLNSYSFDSILMDTSCFDASLKIIEDAYSFKLSTFKSAYKEEEFDENYSRLVSLYVGSQKNRDFESLIQGRILYTQMTEACTSLSIISKTKDKEENTDVENIDYILKFKIFTASIELKNELSILEDKLSKSMFIVDGAKVVAPTINISSEPIRVETINVKR